MIYILVALAGWRTWQRAPRSRAMTWWWLQLALNFAWSPVFFAAHRIDAALVIVAALLAAVAGFMIAAGRDDRTAALLCVPYLAWVAYATLLNAAILMLNGPTG